MLIGADRRKFAVASSCRVAGVIIQGLDLRLTWRWGSSGKMTIQNVLFEGQEGIIPNFINGPTPAGYGGAFLETKLTSLGLSATPFNFLSAKRN
ncbi:hypothetical protein CASFOL_033503 [Castilleja foliolosa]|uniref:Uncharacterized protein n=1 Tax=Castilleja foliolosa TaxID=1961234 RepID=A0ABD3BXS1_9LAMI